MQPEFSPGPQSREQVPLPHAESYEVAPVSLETTSETSQERRMEQRSPIELAPPPPPVAPVVMPPAVVQPVADSTTTSVDPAINPTAANDDDVIEKEWVDRAKQVILQTKDNPFAREKAIGELQRDYLMKRYGRQIGASSD